MGYADVTERFLVHEDTVRMFSRVCRDVSCDTIKVFRCKFADALGCEGHSHELLGDALDHVSIIMGMHI